MTIFLTLLFKLIPLYLIIVLGYIAGKYLQVKKESIAPLLIYIIVPVVVFQGTYSTKIDISILSLPLIFFLLTCSFCLLFYFLSKYMWHDSTRNIFAFAASAGNTGYFGLPVALALFGQDVLGIVVISIFGVVFFENSLGFFITARGHHTLKEAFIKVATLPSLYAFILGLILNSLGITIGPLFTDMMIQFRAVYSILGMMIIGLGLASINTYMFDVKFILTVFFAKFIAWPLVMFGIIFLDSTLFHFYTPQIYKVMILLSVVPVAANTVTYATQLKVQPEKASLVVLLSTLFALFYIPAVVLLFLQ